MPDPHFNSADSAGADLIERFAHRIATRDEPPPIFFDADSVRARLRQALRQRLGQSEPRRLTVLTLLCYEFLAQPELLGTSPALQALTGRTASSLSRAWVELRDAGLVTCRRQGIGYAYRLTRAGEDWMLPVVKGEV